MATMKKEYIERIYAAWVAKTIGIRLGAYIEGWTYEKIKNIYGALDHYPVELKEMAADDDSNGPLFFLKGLELGGKGVDMEAQDVGDALLNYAPFEKGFFWWGGYGVSTEHTAYLNLRNGIKAPLSGSIEMNGAATAEQIGGQIFIDTWGLVAPGNPNLAAKLAEKAASVTHGGNGIYGGIFVAVCISYAFVERDITKILEKGLSYIPKDCEYAKVVRKVMKFHEEHPEDWEECFDFIYKNHGYDKYPGSCHIIPNIAVMILALLYGNGDFSDTLNICNRCGWDTDCNVGNVATIMGVRNGIAAIDYEKWRKPINDFLCCSTVAGSLNAMDLPYGASYIVKMAAQLSGEEIPEPYNTIINERIESCHFEYPGSTHAIRVRVEHSEERMARSTQESMIMNTTESAATGTHSLKIIGKPVGITDYVRAYKKTYYYPEDFHDSRYDPSFSPLAYPGQTIHGSVFIPEYAQKAGVCLYAKEAHTRKMYQGEFVYPEKGVWVNLEYQIPAIKGGMIEEVGFCFCTFGEKNCDDVLVALIDDFYTDGAADYSIEFENEHEEKWNHLHIEVSQFTRVKGKSYLADGEMHLSCADFGETYTGHHEWENYCAEFDITPLVGKCHMVNVRVQGAIRSYAVGFMPDGQLAVMKNENGYRVLKAVSYAWELNKEYHISVTVQGNEIKASVRGASVCDEVSVAARDEEEPYLKGSIGLSVQNGSHLKCKRISVFPLSKSDL